MKITEVTINEQPINTIDDVMNFLKKYELQIVDMRSIASLREDIHKVVLDSRANRIDISFVFPINVICGGDVTLKFYQNGEVYKHESDGDITFLFDNFETENYY